MAATGKGDSAKGGLNGTNATTAQPGPVRVAAIDSLDATYLADGTLQVSLTYTRGCNEALVEILHRALPSDGLLSSRVGVAVLVRDSGAKIRCFALTRETQTLTLGRVVEGYQLVKIDGSDSVKFARIESLESTLTAGGASDVTVTYQMPCNGRFIDVVQADLPGAAAAGSDIAIGVLIDTQVGSPTCLAVNASATQSFVDQGQHSFFPISPL